MSKEYDKWFNEEMDLKDEWQVTLEKAFQAGQRNPVVTIPIQGVTHNFPDRRAELLDLASRLAVADRPKLDGDDLLVTGDCDGFEPMVERAMKQRAAVAVAQATAIIAEVDRVSGEVKA